MRAPLLWLQLLLLMWPGESVGSQPRGPRIPDDAGSHLEDLDWPQNDVPRAGVKVRLGLARAPAFLSAVFMGRSFLLSACWDYPVVLGGMSLWLLIAVISYP